MALRYYEDTVRHYDKLAVADIPLTWGPHLAERVLTRLGLQGKLFYHLKPRGDWHRFNVETRTVELSGPTVTVLDVLHELAHWWEPLHNPHHAMAMQLLVCAYEEL